MKMYERSSVIFRNTYRSYVIPYMLWQISCGTRFVSQFRPRVSVKKKMRDLHVYLGALLGHGIAVSAALVHRVHKTWRKKRIGPNWLEAK